MTAPVFTYSGDPNASERDAVRFLVGDIDPNAFFLNDAEIQYLLDFAARQDSADPGKADIPAAAGAAAEAIAAKLAREISYSADGVSVSADSLAAKFYDMAAKIRTLSRRTDITAAPDVGGILVGETYDVSIRPLVWAVGIHDNAWAGQQDYGGETPSISSGGWSWLGYATPIAHAAAALVSQAAGFAHTGPQ